MYNVLPGRQALAYMLHVSNTPSYLPALLGGRGTCVWPGLSVCLRRRRRDTLSLLLAAGEEREGLSLFASDEERERFLNKKKESDSLCWLQEKKESNYLCLLQSCLCFIGVTETDGSTSCARHDPSIGDVTHLWELLRQMA